MWTPAIHWGLVVLRSTLCINLLFSYLYLSLCVPGYLSWNQKDFYSTQARDSAPQSAVQESLSFFWSHTIKSISLTTWKKKYQGGHSLNMAWGNWGSPRLFQASMTQGSWHPEDGTSPYTPTQPHRDLGTQHGSLSSFLPFSSAAGPPGKSGRLASCCFPGEEEKEIKHHKQVVNRKPRNPQGREAWLGYMILFLGGLCIFKQWMCLLIKIHYKYTLS